MSTRATRPAPPGPARSGEAGADAAQSADPSALEDRIRRSFLAGAAVDLRPEAAARVDGPVPGPRVRAEMLTELLVTAAPRAATAVPALRLRGVTVLGTLCLATAQVPYLIEFTDCAFESAPDLRMASVPGLRLSGCRLPGLAAANLRVAGDLRLDGTYVEGTIELDDAQLGGSLPLSGTTLHNPGGDALRGRGLTVDGSMRATALHAAGRVRIPGARVRGNVNLRGAQLCNAQGDALDAAAIQVGALYRSFGEMIAYASRGTRVGPATSSAAAPSARASSSSPGCTASTPTPTCTPTTPCTLRPTRSARLTPASSPDCP